MKELADLKSWPWISLFGLQFWSAKEITLFDRNRVERTLHLSPILVCEEAVSVRETVHSGRGVAVLPDWLVEEDLQSGRFVRVLAHWKTKDWPTHVVYVGQRLLPARVSAFMDFAVRYMANEWKPCA